MEQLGNDQRHHSFDDTRLKEMYLATRKGDHDLARRVWIEWKIYPSMGGVYFWEWEQLPEPECFERASTLAQLPSPDEELKGLRFPQSLGLFDGRQYDDRHQSQDGRKIAPEKFAFVYAMPDSTEPGIEVYVH